MNSKIEFGLVLGGGAGLGFAHLGVIKFLQELGLTPKYITGTSIGALLGGLISTGKTVDEIMEMTKDFSNSKIIDMKLFPITSGSILRSNKINKYLQDLFGDCKIENLKYKFGCVAVDINSGKLVEFESGELWRAVRASISVPAVFQPFEINGMKCIDGGVMDNLPTTLMRKMGAKKIIAVNLIDYDKVILEQKTIIHSMLNAINLAQKELVRVKTNCDILIQLSLDDVSMTKFNYDNAYKCYMQGYEQAKKYKDLIIKLLD